MGKKAFIVDDETAICALLSALLEKKGLETDTHHQLTGALQKLVEFKPNVLFLDLSLGDGSGFSLIPSIKSKLPETIIVISSAHSGVNERNEAKKLGAHHFLSKPLTSKSVNNILQKIGVIQ